ncbi:DNA glycosylase [Crucibulum laeve]|uniref:DNA glycosylase n=1 Tax=Crucibulum laeve TaxID=68775 RepID=A0A5C3MH09_9AGAR|nr:DNA glycosylase [Crucibulum laeve]
MNLVLRRSPILRVTHLVWLYKMPTTRSATRSATTESATTAPALSSNAQTPQKRKADATAMKETQPKKSRSTKAKAATKSSVDNDTAAQLSVATQVAVATDAEDLSAVLVPAVLTFSFEEAKQHLIGIDHRFEDLFEKMKCKPYEHLERVHPFRALTVSILGQQISWLAARSITHKFRRLFDPSLPEKATDHEESKSVTASFPTPAQVANTSIETLRTAGLSARKAEYVKDLAARFADGRLSTKKLIVANDDELAEMLIEVRGIGRWTVDMFAIFSLRRPDILPVGDLGVQRGLVRWFLSLHSPSHSFSISPQKVGGQASEKKKESKAKKSTKKDKEDDALPVPGVSKDADAGIEQSPDISSIPPATNLKNGDSEGLASLPPAFTPSIKKTLNKPATSNGSVAPPALPKGLTIAELKSRLDGKKKIKGAFLTPQEMTDLTESWKPYRSIGVYYMWSLADAE